MTKLEICERERTNPGQVYLYPEGAFYKAYGVSAWLLCERVHQFKVSVRALKGLDGALLSVGFPISSLEKFTSGAEVYDDENGNGKVLRFCGVVDVSGYKEWASSFSLSVKNNDVPVRLFDSLPVYGVAYRLAVELTSPLPPIPSGKLSLYKGNTSSLKRVRSNRLSRSVLPTPRLRVPLCLQESSLR